MNGNGKSTFIKVDKYDDVMSALTVIKKKLSEAKQTLEKINSLKSEEEAAVQKWSSDLDNVHAKIETIESELREE
jgi:chromosome segregation ATPase